MEIQDTYLLQTMYNVIPLHDPVPGKLAHFLGELSEEINESNEVPASLGKAIVELAKLVAQLILHEEITLSEEHAWYFPLDEEIFK